MVYFIVVGLSLEYCRSSVVPSYFTASGEIMLIGQIDVVMEYSFGRSDHRLEDRAWAPDFHIAAMESGKQAGLLKQMFFIFTFMQSIPESLAVIISPALNSILRIQRVSTPALCTWLFKKKEKKKRTELTFIQSKSECKSRK